MTITDLTISGKTIKDTEFFEQLRNVEPFHFKELPKSLWQASSILLSLVVTLLIIVKIFCVSVAYLASHELIFSISVVKKELTSEIHAEISLAILVLASAMKFVLISARFPQ
jgi:uncharacterized BrkB/YihY/UPF0761 family membrane protein